MNYIPIDIGQRLNKQEILNNFKPNLDKIFNFWSFEKLTESNGGKYGVNDFTMVAKEKYTQLCNYISLLPFTKLSNVKINIQREVAPPHIDFMAPNEGKELYQNNLKNEPSGYRIVVRGKNDVLKLHYENKEKICYMPADTDCYVTNHTSGWHSVGEDKDRITIYISGFIDKDKHITLLNKSKQKYSEYIV